MIKVAWSPIYRYQLPTGHRFPMEKYILLPEQLIYEGTIEQSQFFEPSLLQVEDILITHTLEYWNKLKTLTLTKKEVRGIGFPIKEELITRGRYISMGTVECALHALRFGAALNIAGGTHHAFADRGEGFCVFNDFAITSHYLLSRKLVSKILIVDLDVHQGNGTASIFHKNDQVFTFSMHGQKNYPLRKEVSNLDIALKDGTADEEYLTTLNATLPGLIKDLRPEIILYLSGVDVLEGDKLGRLSLTQAGCKQRDQLVLSLAKKNDIPIAVSMGGGYHKNLPTLIDAHANTFRVAHELFD